MRRPQAKFECARFVIQESRNPLAGREPPFAMLPLYRRIAATEPQAIFRSGDFIPSIGKCGHGKVDEKSGLAMG
jgi:hypothetical protein